MVTPLDRSIGNLRSLNLSEMERAIFVAIRNRAGLSRIEIARSLGLSKGAVSKALAKLGDAGLVHEARETPANGRSGQPAIRIGLQADSVRFVGLNLSTRGAYAAVSNLSLDAVWTSPHEPLAESGEAIVVQSLALVEAAQRHAGPASDIGMFVPAIFSASEDILEVTPRQAMVPYEQVRLALRARFPDSEVVASSRADVMQSALLPSLFGQVLFHLACADGVGGQIFDRSRIVRGGFNQAGNIGGMVPEPGPRPSVTDLAITLGCSPAELDLQRLESLFADRNPVLLDWIDSRAEVVSWPLSAVVQLVNPQKIILGGNLPQSILGALRDKIDLDKYDVPGRMPLTKPDMLISDVIGEARRAVAASTLPLASFLRYLA
ncbi:ROK family transcriptional regulator [Devosia sp. FKR38]|uniref:ROK family transcriptional regulator n=1 Tax=Devosia sp. FKR38 TaxID=2562312 RepID=UPI0010C03D57|nr:ROK family transcriptional regulator [Devosia sp. FKR38]